MGVVPWFGLIPICILYFHIENASNVEIDLYISSTQFVKLGS